MTLPMHSPPSETVVNVASAAPASPPAPRLAGPPSLPMHAPATAVAPVAASAAAPVSKPMEASDTEVELDGVEVLHYPPLPLLVTPAPVTPPVASIAAPDSRPVIRPAVASPIAAASAGSSARRVPIGTGAALATAHLGIEESEFDKPTYLRRALAGEGLRLPGDKA
jgi:hypothetical protein